MVLLFEHVDVVLEADQNRGNVLQVVLFKSLKLFDSAEKLLKFSDSATEQVELAKNLVGAEVKLLGLGHVLKTFLCELILLDVCLMQVKASLESSDQFIRWVLLVIPKKSIINRCSFFA